MNELAAHPRRAGQIRETLQDRRADAAGAGRQDREASTLPTRASARSNISPARSSTTQCLHDRECSVTDIAAFEKEALAALGMPKETSCCATACRSSAISSRPTPIRPASYSYLGPRRWSADHLGGVPGDRQCLQTSRPPTVSAPHCSPPATRPTASFAYPRVSGAAIRTCRRCSSGAGFRILTKGDFGSPAKAGVRFRWSRLAVVKPLERHRNWASAFAGDQRRATDPRCREAALTSVPEFPAFHLAFQVSTADLSCARL